MEAKGPSAEAPTASAAVTDLDLRTLVVGCTWGLIAATLAAGWMVFTRMGVLLTLSPYDITAIRFGVAGAILLPVVLRRGISVGGFGWLGAVALATGAGLPYALIATMGFEFAPALHAGVMIPGAMPFFAAFLSALLLAERLSRRRGAGLVLIFAGILLIGGSGLFHGPGGQWIGDGLFLTASAMWAGYTVGIRSWGVAPLHATAIVCVLSMAFYLPVYVVVFGGAILRAPPWEVLFQAVYQGILTSIVLLVAFSRMVATIGAGRGAAFMALVPALAALLAVPVLGESPSLWDGAGIVAVTVGVYYATGARLGGDGGATS